LKAQELLGLTLITGHNIFFMNELMAYIRQSIEIDNFEEAKKKWYLD
jgi:tRNA-guanine family transglycosylase